MTYAVIFAAEVTADFAALLRHLTTAYVAFGQDEAEAVARAAARIRAIRADIEGLAKTPYRGTLRPEIGPGLRNITFKRAIVWFDVDEQRSLVRVLAVFFGGQDHLRRVAARRRDDLPPG